MNCPLPRFAAATAEALLDVVAAELTEAVVAAEALLVVAALVVAALVVALLVGEALLVAALLGAALLLADALLVGAALLVAAAELAPLLVLAVTEALPPQAARRLAAPAATATSPIERNAFRRDNTPPIILPSGE